MGITEEIVDERIFCYSRNFWDGKVVIITHVCNESSEGVGINPFCGITTVQSEGFTTVLNHLQHCKENPINAIVLSLYVLPSKFLLQ